MVWDTALEYIVKINAPTAPSADFYKCIDFPLLDFWLLPDMNLYPEFLALWSGALLKSAVQTKLYWNLIELKVEVAKQTHTSMQVPSKVKLEDGICTNVKIFICLKMSVDLRLNLGIFYSYILLNLTVIKVNKI